MTGGDKATEAKSERDSSRRRPVTVLVIGLSWPPRPFLAGLLRGLLDEGVFVKVASASPPDEPWRRDPRLSWIWTPRWTGSFSHRILRLFWVLASALLRSPRDARQLLSSRRRSRTLERLRVWNRLLPFAGRSFDIVYFPWNSAAIEHLALYDLRRPVLVSCRGSQIYIAPHDPRRVSFQKGLRRSLARARAVHCVSESIRNEASRYGLDSAKSHVIRPAVDTEFFRPSDRLDAGDSRLRLISVGSLVWVKGFEYALEALSLLKTEGFPLSLVICGDGPDRQRLQYTIHDLDLGSTVSLSGNLSHEALRSHFQRADVFFMTSLSEGIANAALEAMACALPVVTTDCGGMREVVTDGVEGLVVPLRSPKSMARAISTLWSDPGLRRKMGEAARARVVASFALDSQVRRFARLCRDLALS